METFLISAHSRLVIIHSWSVFLSVPKVMENSLKEEYRHFDEI